jgi:hypothetical protein
VKLLSQNELDRRELERARRASARASRQVAEPADDGASASVTVWRARDLPAVRTGAVGVPLSEGVTSVFLGAVLYIPVALVTGYAGWNYVVAAVLTVALSYAVCSRRVVVGPEFVAVRKFGPYRVASIDSVTSGGLTPSQRGGVMTLRTGDGRTMRLRRVEFSHPDVNAALRAFLLRTGRRYDQRVMLLLDLPWREDFGHHRYLLDAVQ